MSQPSQLYIILTPNRKLSAVELWWRASLLSKLRTSFLDCFSVINKGVLTFYFQFKPSCMLRF